MARKASISKKLENHITEIESKISALQDELAVAKTNYENYVTHRQVIESILSLREAPDVSAPKRKYTKRVKS